jgi:hypothetical protein
MIFCVCYQQEPGDVDEEEAEDSGSDYDDWNNDDWSSIDVSSSFRFGEVIKEKSKSNFDNFCYFLQKKEKTASVKEEEFPAFTQTGGKSASHFFTDTAASSDFGDDGQMNNDPFSTLVRNSLSFFLPQEANLKLFLCFYRPTQASRKQDLQDNSSR